MYVAFDYKTSINKKFEDPIEAAKYVQDLMKKDRDNVYWIVKIEEDCSLKTLAKAKSGHLL